MILGKRMGWSLDHKNSLGRSPRECFKISTPHLILFPRVRITVVVSFLFVTYILVLFTFFLLLFFLSVVTTSKRISRSHTYTHSHSHTRAGESSGLQELLRHGAALVCALHVEGCSQDQDARARSRTAGNRGVNRGYREVLWW
jgi:hypothetical protein